MNIFISSEIDTRNIIYPLIRSLYNLGTVCIISNNRQLRRLIVDEDEQGFSNVTVYVDENATADEMLEDYNIGRGDYDYVIADNNGLSSYDLHIITLGKRNSERFEEELTVYREENNVKFIQFGAPYKNKATEQRDKEAKNAEREKRRTADRRKGKSEESVVEVSTEEEYDPASKWIDLTDEYAINRKARTLKTQANFYPSAHIEEVEAMHKFLPLDQAMINIMYELLAPYIGISKTVFAKGLRK